VNGQIGLRYIKISIHIDIMSKSPLSYDDIAGACTRLTARGQRPSLRLVRAEIGRGSLTTIHEHLVRWNAESRAAQGPPHEAIRALEALAPSAVPGLRDAFRAEVAAELQEAREAERQVRESVGELLESLAASESARAELAERLQAMESRVRAVEALAEQVAALGPQLAGRLEAHTAHLIDAHQDQAQAAAEREGKARRQHSDLLQALSQEVTSAVAAISVQGEEGRRQADDGRTRLRALEQAVGAMGDAVTVLSARMASHEAGGGQRWAHLHTRLNLHEALLRKTLAGQSRASALPPRRR
jgi:Plasmid replication region DNA-binding N-term